MQKSLLFAGALMLAFAANAQTDTTKQTSDTVRIGGMIIIKKKSTESPDDNDGSTEIKYEKGTRKAKRVTTNWWTFDLGFANFTDKTNYNSAAAQSYAVAGAGQPSFSTNDFSLRNGKSVNANIWIFRQKYGITRDRVVKLTYGLMLELNNYRYENNISYRKTPQPYVFRDSIGFNKNKLALDYITVPIMLGFDTKPSGKGFTVSGGVSIGYLYSSRNKQISDERGTVKTKGNIGAEPFKFQYIGEVGLGPIKLYGSYAPETMFKSGLDMRPYNFGVRFGG